MVHRCKHCGLPSAEEIWEIDGCWYHTPCLNKVIEETVDRQVSPLPPKKEDDNA